MKRKDVVFLVLILILSAVIYLLLPRGGNGGNTVIIKKNGRVFAEKSLYDSCEIDIDGSNTAVIENGEVYMKSADCPDKLCIKQGAVHDGSKKIICLPNRVIIEVTKKSDIDAVVR
ncbi:MAG: NusG domain II-containing protein [Clostridiales bacterium]|nr:NusG domain II-containing protein [Clostridiales bacterium]